MICRIVAIVVGLCLGLVFLFVPETFWDRTPRPHAKHRHHLASLSNIFHHHSHEHKSATNVGDEPSADRRKLVLDSSAGAGDISRGTIAQRRQQKTAHVGFAVDVDKSKENIDSPAQPEEMSEKQEIQPQTESSAIDEKDTTEKAGGSQNSSNLAFHEHADRAIPKGEGPKTPALRNFNSPSYVARKDEGPDYLDHTRTTTAVGGETPGSVHTDFGNDSLSEKSSLGLQRYTSNLRNQPPKTYKQTLKPWNGRLNHEKWFRAAVRPFILFAYPSILWSTLVYSLSIGWLIVLSESVTTIFRNKDTYNFTALQAGLVYISPFIGGVLGTAVAGKVSDIIVRFMSRRNGGIYEPEFRLIMAIPVTVSTCIGLMGYGWSAQERDSYIVPTIFFGIISFGCSLGSTTAITFAVDSYRQYAGEALVTLNFSKSELRTPPFKMQIDLD